jgi:penicillin-binding protein 1C
MVLGLGLIGRSLPALAPIRAADLRQDDQAIEFTDRNGFPLGTLLSRNQDHTVVVPLEQVAPVLIQAILAAEDSRFFQHGALDWRAIARALVEALQAGRVVSGASTITMQLARLVEPTPHSLWGKGQEVWLSWRLAAGMSQREILQAYLNRLPMGGNLYGIEAAARVYFGVPARDLNVAQASLLAALPNDPTYLNPYYRWHALKQRQAYVLRRMVEDGYLTQAQRAYQEKPVLLPRQQGILAAPHFLFWVANQLPPNHTPRLQTTLDRPLQQFVEAQVRQVTQTLASHNVQQAAALVIDNHSGEVLAYVGSADYFSETRRGRNDGVQALRQPGSTLKPFVYQLALERRLIRPNTVLADVPTYYAIPGAQLYSPIDYSETFQGPVRLRIALANSLNVPAVRVLEHLTVPVFLERLQQLGFQHLNHAPDYYGLGLALGSGEVSLWELARAYITLARQGKPVDLVVLRPDASSLHPAERTQAGIGTPQTWALVTDMLGDRQARAKAFGVDSVLSLPFPAAVKTGTSSNFRDTWTVGFTRDYTVATWVGNFSGEPMRQVSGVTGAAPLWSRIMLHLHEGQEAPPLAPPDGWVKRPICALSGLKPTPTCPAIVEEYFNPADLTNYEQTRDPIDPAVLAPQTSPSNTLKFPAESQGWLAERLPVDATSGPLQLLSPRHGDTFLVATKGPQHPTQRPQPRLELKLLTVPKQPVEWWLNGKLLATTSKQSVFWPIRPGHWTLEVRNATQHDQIAFEVQAAEPQPAHRGFSLAQP